MIPAIHCSYFVWTAQIFWTARGGTAQIFCFKSPSFTSVDGERDDKRVECFTLSVVDKFLFLLKDINLKLFRFDINPKKQYCIKC